MDITSRLFLCATVIFAACSDDDGGSARVCDKAHQVAEACGSAQLGDMTSSGTANVCELPTACENDADGLIEIYDCVETRSGCHDGMSEDPFAGIGCFLEGRDLLSDACADELLQACSAGRTCLNDTCTCSTAGKEGVSCCSEDQCPETDPNSCSTVCKVCEPL